MTKVAPTNPQPLSGAPSPRPRTAQPGSAKGFSIGGKLALLSGLMLLGSLIPQGILAFNAKQASQDANRAAAAASAYLPMAQLQQAIRSVRSRNPKEIPAEAYQAIETQLAALSASAAATENAELVKNVNALIAQEKAVLADLKAGKINSTQNFQRSTAVMENMNSLFRDYAKLGNMLGTADGAQATLVNVVGSILPPLLPAIGGAFGDAMVPAQIARDTQGGVMTEAQKVELQNKVALGRSRVTELQRAYNNLFYYAPDLKPALEADVNTAVTTTNDIFSYLENKTINAPTVTESDQAFYDTSDRYLAPQYALFTKSAGLLRERYALKAESAYRTLLLTAITIFLTVSLITILALLVTRSITRPLQNLINGTRRLSQGSLDTQVPVTSNDELGVLSSSFNEAVGQLRRSAERDASIRQESVTLQSNIGNFLDVAMDIAEGDLTKRGNVTQDVLGNVVDSINLMADELADTLKQVRQTSDSVSSGSAQMLGTTRQIEQGAQFTAAEAQRVAQRVEEITATIREMAENAQQSAGTARQALLATQEGQQAVRDTLEGMQNIRREVQQISKRVKSLGDRSLEIQEIVDTISQIAEQTHLLAVNATIEAAGAGEAGGRFGIVADSVRKLATTASDATTRIASLIKNVQTEVQDVIVETEEGTREVEQGYRVASTAGEKLQQIGQLTEQSAQFAESIASTTQQQATGVEEVNSTVQQIANVAQESEQAVQQGRQAAEQLQVLARQLDQNLSRFKLPS